MRNAYDMRNADMIFKLQNSQHPNINTNDLYQFTPSSSNKNRQYRVTKPVALVLAPVSQKPVVPVSAGGAQLGAQRPERKKEGLEKVEGML